MTYQIGSITITAEELADMKRMDIDCKFWIKMIAKAQKRASKNNEMVLQAIKHRLEKQ